MTRLGAPAATLFILGLILGPILAMGTISAAASDRMPWKTKSNAIIIDAYELNIIDWNEMLEDRRIAGFISKASDGLPASYTCEEGHGGDTIGHCRTMWRKYSVSRELYQTRRMLAKAQGLLWGAYHLARPGNPIDQANHFLDFADPAEDELMVLDLEDIDSERFMSLADAEIFANHIKTRTGRYPVLYTNHSTARTIAAARELYPTLSRLPLWYARYKPDISGVFPLGNWESYALWQFATMHNCGPSACPYRVPGTMTDIDVNVAAMSKDELAEVWPFGELVPERPMPATDEGVLMAYAPTPTENADIPDFLTTASIPPAANDADGGVEQAQGMDFELVPVISTIEDENGPSLVPIPIASPRAILATASPADAGAYWALAYGPERFPSHGVRATELLAGLKAMPVSPREGRKSRRSRIVPANAETPILATPLL